MITINLNELFVPILLAIISSYVAFKMGVKPEKQKTSRLMFEKSFLPIFKYLEKDLYNKSLSFKEVQELANQILTILSTSNGYYQPSVKDYALQLKRSSERDYMEHWIYFSKRFSYRYDKVCKDIGVPLRSSAYRVNQRQYTDWSELLILCFKLFWPAAIFILILFYLFYRLKNL